MFLFSYRSEFERKWDSVRLLRAWPRVALLLLYPPCTVQRLADRVATLNAEWWNKGELTFRRGHILIGTESYGDS